MNTILLQGGCNILKGKLKQAWALVTGDDEDYEEGKTVEYLGRVQQKTGEKRAAIRRARRECEKLRLRSERERCPVRIKSGPLYPYAGRRDLCRVSPAGLCVDAPAQPARHR